MIPYRGVRTLGALLAERAGERPEAVFVTAGGRSVTYAEADRRANRLAHGLAALGVTCGTAVGLVLDNRLEYLDAWFALARLGAIEVPLNPALLPHQLGALLADSGAVLVVTEPRHRPAVAEAVAGAGLEPVIVVPDGMAALTAGRPDTAPEVTVEPADPFAIMHTSGTTSAAKGVVLCHEHDFTLAETMVDHLGITPDDVFYNCFPLFHNTAQGMITWAVLRAGASMVLAERFSGSRFWTDVTAGNCSLFFTMGPMVEFLLQRARAGEPGGVPGSHRLRRGFGIGFSAAAAAEFRARFGVALSGGYGSTEVNLVTVHPDDDPRLDTAGKPLPDFEVAVVDERDRIVAAGATGEIVVRPRRPFTTSLGYHGRAQETAAARRGGWLHTGDAGRFDADGYLHFVDRLRDVIRRRGENIASGDVEAAARTFPGLVDCAAVAVPSGLAVGDDEVYLAVVVAEPAAFEPATLIAHCAGLLPPFAVPRFVAVWPSLPATPNGKVRKVEIRALADPSTAWDRDAAGVPVGREGVR